MGGARGVSKAEQERRARQRAGTPTREDLGGLEKRFKRQEEKIRTSDLLTSEQKRVRINKLRTDFRGEWIQTRQRIIEQQDADLVAARRAANPPADEPMLQRMGLLSNVHVAAWTRRPGNLIRDAERFSQEGDVAGLRLAREHAGLVDNQGARTALLKGIAESLDEHATDDQRAAANQVRSLESEGGRFELGTGLRERFIRASTTPLGPPAADPVSSAYPRPQR